MQRFGGRLITPFLMLAWTAAAFAQETITVRPHKIDDVLRNPCMGFATSERFNGDGRADVSRNASEIGNRRSGTCYAQAG